MLYQLNLYFLWFVIYSIFGWIYESIYCSIDNRRLINRGFLNGPYCPIYGSGAVLNLLILDPSMHPVVIFLSAAFLTGILEYLTSFFMELLFDARWWDYSDKRFNINGRIFLLGILAFGSFSLLLIEFIHPFVSRYTALLSPDGLTLVCLVLFTILLSDTVFTLTRLIEFKEYLKLVYEGLNNAASSVKNIYNKAGDRISGGIQKINPQIRRMILSFPKLRSKSYDLVLAKLREVLIREKEMLKRKKKELLGK